MTSAKTLFPHEVTLTGSGGQDGEVSFEGATIQPTAENTELQYTKHPLGAEAMVTLLVHHCLKPAWMGVFVFLKSKSNLHFFRNQEHLSFPAPNQYRQCHLVLQCRILLNLRLKFLCLPIGKTTPASTPQWVFWEWGHNLTWSSIWHQINGSLLPSLSTSLFLLLGTLCLFSVAPSFHLHVWLFKPYLPSGSLISCLLLWKRLITKPPSMQTWNTADVASLEKYIVCHQYERSPKVFFSTSTPLCLETDSCNRCTHIYTITSEINGKKLGKWRRKEQKRNKTWAESGKIKWNNGVIFVKRKFHCNILYTC